MEKRQKGVSLLEFLIAVTILSIITLGYIKYYSDVQSFKYEQHLVNEVTTGAFNYHDLLLLRVYEKNLSFSHLKNYVDNFTYNDCSSQQPTSFEEFNMNFCHIISTNKNASFKLKQCGNNNSLCLQYRGNRFAEAKCNALNNCHTIKLWGLISKSDSIQLKGDNHE